MKTKHIPTSEKILSGFVLVNGKKTKGYDINFKNGAPAAACVNGCHKLGDDNRDIPYRANCKFYKAYGISPIQLNDKYGFQPDVTAGMFAAIGD